MQLLFCPLFSGSSGNAVYVGDGESGVLVDAGVSCARIVSELDSIGIRPDGVKALLVTHEHADHVSGAGIFSRRFDVPVYATEGTWRAMEGKIGEISPKNARLVDVTQDFFIGGMNVAPFPLPHDAAEPCGYSFYLGGVKASVATDIGCVRDSWMKAVLGSDLVLLEANYDPDMLKAGKYPYALKTRILGRRGHLSNEDAGRAAAQLIEGGTKTLLLGHLSKENNFPELARMTVECALREAGIDPDNDASLAVASRDHMSGLYALRDGGAARRCL